jgi:hypothetical protein
MKRVMGSRGKGAVAAGLLLVAMLSQAPWVQPALAQPASIDPEAARLLKASTDFLAGQQRFSVDTDSSIDVVLASGQKLQFDHSAKVSVARPDKFRAERTGDLIDQVFFYDGKTLTLHNPLGKYYATIAAPGTIEEMLDFAREKLDVVAPAGDFLYRNAYDILMRDVTSGFVVGKGVVDGVLCEHLAFRAPSVDWQIWIEEGKRPLVRKLVITSLDMLNAPQFIVMTRSWNLKPGFNDSTFSFKPPQWSQKVEFVLKDAGPLKAPNESN